MTGAISRVEGQPLVHPGDSAIHLVLANYFPAGPYRFQMQFGRGTFAEFYRATEDHAFLLGERRHWLSVAADRYLVYLPESQPLLDEAARLGMEHGTLPVELNRFHSRAELARALGENWEPDYLLLSRQNGDVRLVCACVCFPSSWAVEEKIDRPIEQIHEVVPGLNASIGLQIHTFLERIKPGTSWTRSNWGLSRSRELNQHPTRNIPRLDHTVKIEEIFFRVEEQSLVSLPASNGILFGIRIKVFPLADFLGTPAAAKLTRALETMPEPMARYKGIAAARPRILELLNQV